MVGICILFMFGYVVMSAVILGVWCEFRCGC